MDLRGEAQQASVGVGRRLAGGGGETILLVGALQHEHGPVLHVGGLLHHLWIQHQVGSRCGREHRRDADRCVRNKQCNNDTLMTERHVISYSQNRRRRRRSVPRLSGSSGGIRDAGSETATSPYQSSGRHSSPRRRSSPLPASTTSPGVKTDG